MNVKHIVLSERGYRENPTCCMISFSGKVQSRHIYRDRKWATGWWCLVVDFRNNGVSVNRHSYFFREGREHFKIGLCCWLHSSAINQ